MKKLTTILSTLLLGFSITACSINVDGVNQRIKASENYVTKEFKVSDFNKVRLSGSGDVYFTQKAGAPAVSVVTSDNVAEVLDVYVENNTLYLKFKKGYSISNLKKLDFTVNAAALTSAVVAGSGDIKLMGGLTTDQLEISVSGSGEIDCDNVNCTGPVKVSITGSGDIDSDLLKCTDLTASVSGSGEISLDQIDAQTVEASITGSGEISLEGKTVKANLGISGSGDIDADELIAQDVKARTTGSGEITCYASQSIEATRSGSGSIGYKGNPAKVDVSKKGVHSIH